MRLVKLIASNISRSLTSGPGISSSAAKHVPFSTAILALFLSVNVTASLQNWRERPDSHRLCDLKWLTWPIQAYNMLDRSGRQIMKSITLLIMIFLPASFISVKGSA